ncbi:MAG TPA: C4-type zinc ribbon domain-containing protein [Nitriliruptorales bacterium]|nr:C4-type zinc ribbon domain-containing protein [Nitriliruptorales bacterium]
MADGQSSRADLEALLTLQEAEATIRRLERRLDGLPEQAALDAALQESAAVQAERDALRVDLDLVEAEMRKLEGELSLLQQRRDHEQRRMYGGEITNPRELQALRAELENVKDRISGREDALLDVMERREEVVGALEALERRQQELAAEHERLTAVRDEAAEELLAELADARARRDAEHARVPADLLSRYDAKKRRLGGVGVGALRDGVCSACHLELTPLEISELRSGSPLGTCPQCQRLLVVLEG